MESLPQTGYNQGFMRRGTHSCVECRRRKVRCLFAPDDQISCITCKKKGRVCQEQRREHFPSTNAVTKKKRSLKDRVAKLEALLNSSGIQEGDDDDDDDHDQDGQSPSHPASEKLRRGDSSTAGRLSVGRDESRLKYRSAEESGEDDEDEYDPDPLVSLFNNNVLRAQEPKRNLKTDDTYQPNIDLRIAAKRVHVLSRLRTNLISPVLLRDILAVTSDWFKGWRPIGPWPVEFTVAGGYATLQDFLMFAFNSDVPAIVGLAVLCIAESVRKLQIQSTVHAELIQQLSRPPQEIFQILFEQVDRLINSDSDFSNTKEGIDCLLMSGKLFSSLGLPRRTWMTFHKVIIYGQYHGLHRPNPRPGEPKEKAKERQAAWDTLCQTDLFISMTLGLPYITPGRNIPLKYFGPPGDSQRFQSQIMRAAAMLIDRNQSGLIMELEPTENIIKALEEAAEPMSTAFWTSPDTLVQIIQGNVGMQHKLSIMEQTRYQMFYWLITMFTYLPFSVASLERSEFESHRLACQRACRGHLIIYNILRSDKRADLANVIDYQAFISCSVLILGLLGYGNIQVGNLQMLSQDVGDRDLVARTLQTMRNASEGNANFIAGQALEGINSLFRLADTEGSQIGSPGDIKTKLRIPYVGTITVNPGPDLQHVPTSMPNIPAQTPAPVFTFMHPEVYSPEMMHQYYTMDNTAGQQYPAHSQVDPMQNKLYYEPMDAEYTSINFDFDQLMAMNGEDWTWISAEYPPESYY